MQETALHLQVGVRLAEEFKDAKSESKCRIKWSGEGVACDRRKGRERIGWKIGKEREGGQGFAQERGGT